MRKSDPLAHHNKNQHKITESHIVVTRASVFGVLNAGHAGAGMGARRRLTRPMGVVRPLVSRLSLEDGPTSRKRARREGIVAKLRQADVLVAQGQGVVEVIRTLGVSEVTTTAGARSTAG
jgi:hypothetical protein